MECSSLHDSSHLSLSTIRYQHRCGFLNYPCLNCPHFCLVFHFILFELFCHLTQSIFIHLYLFIFYLPLSLPRKNVCSMMGGAFFTLLITVTLVLGTVALYKIAFKSIYWINIQNRDAIVEIVVSRIFFKGTNWLFWKQEFKILDWKTILVRSKEAQ